MSKGKPSPPDAREVGEVFLKAMAAEYGYHSLPSGVLFRLLTAGSGTTVPLPDDTCEVTYRGALISGAIFDSNAQGLRIKPSECLRGWAEALSVPVIADVADIVVPWALGYGEAGSPPRIPPFSTLVFRIELVDIHGVGKECEEDRGNLLEDPQPISGKDMRKVMYGAKD